MLKKLFKPFYTIVIFLSVFILYLYIKESSFSINLNSILIILITIVIESYGFFNYKDNFGASLSFSLSVFILLIFGPLIAILANSLVFIIPPIIKDIKNSNNKNFHQRYIKIIFNISQGIITIFMAERVLYLLNNNLNNTLDIWKILIVVLAYYYSNAILITLIISFNKGQFIKDIISLKNNYYILFYFILFTPTLIYNYYDRGYIGLSFILIIVYTMQRSIKVYKSWKEQEEKIFKDELTGVYNYRYFSSIIDSNIISKKEFSLIIIDIDNFKEINDIHGHVAGDYLLRNLSNTILEVLKKDGILCRHGGDEFSVILNSNDKAFNISSSILNSINILTTKYKDNNLKINASIGYYSYKGEDITKDELIDRADRAMNKARNSNLKLKICEAI